MEVPHSPLNLNSNDAAAGCLSGILRRFLCGSLRNRVPGDGDESPGVDIVLKQEQKPEQNKAASPSIVARLMGLDSMPVFPFTPPESIKRSRSTNSAESWPVLCSERSQGVHIRTSLSFREVPTYLRQENEDFLLLSFSPEDREKSFVTNGSQDNKIVDGMKEEKSENSSRLKNKSKAENKTGENKKRNEKSNSKKESAPERSNGCMMDSVVPSRQKDAARKNRRRIVKSENQKQMPAYTPERSTIDKKKLLSAEKKVEAESSSQESSPVSVLDHHCIESEYSSNPNSPSSENAEEEHLPKQHGSRRKLSSRFEDVNCSFPPSLQLDTIPNYVEKKTAHEQCQKSSKLQPISPDCTEIWGKISMLIEEDMDNSNWISRKSWNSEEVEDIAAVVGKHILDLLVQDATCELSS